MSSDDAAGADQATESYTLSVNGADRPVADAWIGESLLYVLRERLGLPGSKNACEQGECGSCSVLLDGVLVASCCVLAADAAGSDVRTVEGLSPEGELTDVQRAFVEQGAVQCGFCIPGMIVAIHDLLDRQPDADELALREAISGNLCRCTGYGRVFAAFHAVKQERARAST
jgi:aerobic carbon-monoxide dehydrogenase small subunit